MTDEKIGKVKILKTLGTGAHSTILHVRREADAREFALKLVPIETEDDKKFLEQAKHEFRVGQMLHHPNLIKVCALEMETDWLRRVKKAKLLVEYVDGNTLDQVKLLKISKMLRVFEQVAAGLVHMHKQGVLHADLKPGNILMGKKGVVKIIDYGLSWIKSEPKDRVQGTPEYMAPETVQRKMVNERTDIYNFGATMYRLVTLKLPPEIIPGVEGVEMTERQYKDHFVPVNEINRGVPKDLADLIHKCLSFKANNRPERMSEVQGTLDRLADELGGDDDE
ncbi:serine/threonine protein kinase [Limnoglobus roseus]|nr:serine/threonine-protein kinase [Limnoglobus roseus]